MFTLEVTVLRTCINTISNGIDSKVKALTISGVVKFTKF